MTGWHTDISHQQSVQIFAKSRFLRSWSLRCYCISKYCILICSWFLSINSSRIHIITIYRWTENKLSTLREVKKQTYGSKNCKLFHGTHTVPGVEVTHLILDKGVKVRFLQSVGQFVQFLQLSLVLHKTFKQVLEKTRLQITLIKS